MKNSLLFRLVVLVAAVMCALGVNAQEAYAVYTSDNAALSFYYDNDRSSRTGTTYDLNDGPADPGWVTDFTNLSVKQVVFDPSFEAARPISTFYWFSGMRNLVTITGLEYLNTSEVTRMDDMFNRCYKLTSLNLEKFNLAKVTDMSEMFRSCTALQTIYVGDGWKMSEMAQTVSRNVFKDCTSLVGGKGTAYDAAHVDADYAHIDGGADNPGYLSAGTMSYVCYTPENTTLTFYYDNQRDSRPGRIYDLNVGINRVGWELDHTCGEVTNTVIDPSFADARPTTTYAWFYGMDKIDTIIGLEYLNTSEVTIMNWMFGHSTNLEHIDVSHFNTDKVTSMYAMFGDCQKLKTLDLSNWNTANVTDMGMMFSYCLELKTIYVGSGWNTDCVTLSEHMFINDFLLVGGQGTAYDVDHVDAAYAHIDGGTGNPGYFTDKFNPVAYAVFDNTILTFYYDFERNSRPGRIYELNTGDNFPAWIYDGITGIVQYAVFDPSFADARPTSTNSWFMSMQFLKSIAGMENLNTSEVTDMGDMFLNCSSLSSIDVSHFNTEKVTFMAGLFAECKKLKILDLSSFNTVNVASMRSMFLSCYELQTIYVGDGWSTASTIGSGFQMFQDCNNLVGGQGTTYDPNHTEEDYAHIDGGPSNPGYFSLNDVVEKPQVIWCEDNTTLYFINSETIYNAGDTYDGQTVTNAWSGFAVTATSTVDDPDFSSTVRNYCTRVVFDESFATVRPTSCHGWFNEFRQLTVIEGIENLNTSNVSDMTFMFGNCEKLTVLDLSNFNTAKVTSVLYMFYGCYNLRTIFVGDGWSTAAVISGELMFSGCTRLVGGMGTTYDHDHVDADYAHIDGGPSNPGYFTTKPARLRGDVDSDGHVDINDVTLLIDVVLGKNVVYNANEADCNTATGDGTIDIDDVTALIARVLNGTWPWEEAHP